jgi:hypothetical protein
MVTVAPTSCFRTTVAKSMSGVERHHCDRRRQRRKPGAELARHGIGDYNNDGKSDILLQSSSGDVAIWEMDGTSVIGSASLANPGPTLAYLTRSISATITGVVSDHLFL